MPITLSICIVNWNTRELLRACLQSIYRYPPDALFEVIVVDNASSDGSADMVQAEFPQAVLIANTENLGYARGNNQAIQQAQGEYLLLLNPDTEVFPDTLNCALAFLAAHSEAGAIGAKQLFPDGRVQPSVRGFPTPANLLWEVSGLARLFPRALGVQMSLQCQRVGVGHKSQVAQLGGATRHHWMLAARCTACSISGRRVAVGSTNAARESSPKLVRNPKSTSSSPIPWRNSTTTPTASPLRL